MTLPSRHRIRNSNPWGLRSCTLPPGHGDSPQYFRSGWGRNMFISFKPPEPGTEPRTLAWKAAVLTITLVTKNHNTPFKGHITIMFCVYWVERSPAIRGVEPVLAWCWGSFADFGPALDQHWVNVVFAGSVDKCFAPKRDNNFRLMHSLCCPQEPFNNNNYKGHRHYIY